jgi:hypothetical protein
MYDCIVLLQADDGVVEAVMNPFAAMSPLAGSVNPMMAPEPEPEAPL